MVMVAFRLFTSKIGENYEFGDELELLAPTRNWRSFEQPPPSRDMHDLEPGP